MVTGLDTLNLAKFSNLGGQPQLKPIKHKLRAALRYLNLNLQLYDTYHCPGTAVSGILLQVDLNLASEVKNSGTKLRYNYMQIASCLHLLNLVLRSTC
eukprot:SAG31_NODE_1270_length_9065_cov_7.007473_7_plen_98_part_00